MIRGTGLNKTVNLNEFRLTRDCTVPWGQLLVGTHRAAPSCGTAGARSGVSPPQAGAWRGIWLVTSGRLPPVLFEPLGINWWGQILRAKVRLSRVDPVHALDLTNSQERSRTCVPHGA